MTFARVASEDGKFTSAITAPSLPVGIAARVLSIGGLQPHVRAHRQPHVSPHAVLRAYPANHARPSIFPTVTGAYNLFTPADIAAAYNVPSSVTGAGQTIAILGDANVQASDLTSFWNTVGVARTSATVTTVPVSGGAGTTAILDAEEAALDVEWAGAMAPAAAIRLYTTPDLDENYNLAVLSQIITDAKSISGLTVASLSFAYTESEFTAGTVASLNQEFAQVAAAGITFCSASGDGGSNPSASNETYSPSNPLTVCYPASDPNVTGVGGTTILFNSSFGDDSEATWFSYVPGSPGYGSGGGISVLFSRPSWQIGTGMPTGTTRCVPDVALVANGVTGNNQYFAFIVVGGNPYGVSGTSLATPVFAGLLALVNQARATGGLSSLGLLGPRIYPLIGTNAFNDITTGANGTYSAGAGYDCCTGIGSPIMANLIVALGGLLPPAISPQAYTVTEGAGFSFSTTATGGSLTHQWTLNGAPILGAIGATYSKASAIAADAGSYLVVDSNAAGSVASNPATLTVISTPANTSQPQSASTTVGSGFSFSVTASGGSLTYQWLLNGVAISGATSATYSRTSATSVDAGSYSVVVSNAAGSVTSLAATLTVNAVSAPVSGGGGGGGGSGGAPSLWFYGALAAAVLARHAFRRREDRRALSSIFSLRTIL